MSHDRTVIFDPTCYAALIDHAREGTPREICGVLGGQQAPDRDTYHIDCSIPVTNVAETPRHRYRLDPAEQLAAMDRIEATGRTVVGFYHSHPQGSSIPSAVDHREATWPGTLYVIVAPTDEPSIRAWWWDQTADSFDPVSVRKRTPE